jgi:hypothetical protein
MAYMGVDSTETKADDQSPKTDLAKWLVYIAASTIGIIVFARGASFDIISPSQ